MVEIRGSIPLGPIKENSAQEKRQGKCKTPEPSLDRARPGRNKIKLNKIKMGIKLDEIEKFAQQFLGFLDKNLVDSIYDLDRLLGKKLPIDAESFFLVELRPPTERADEYTLSYAIKGRGIPIEARINPRLDYIRFIVRANKPATGYEVSGFDAKMENYVMHKEFKGHDFGEVRKELRSLTELTRGGM